MQEGLVDEAVRMYLQLTVSSRPRSEQAKAMYTAVLPWIRRMPEAKEITSMIETGGSGRPVRHARPNRPTAAARRCERSHG